MKYRHIRKSVVPIVLLLLLSMTYVTISITSVFSDEKIHIKVALHKVKDSGVTDADFAQWLSKANEAFGCSLVFEDGTPDEANQPKPESGKETPDPAPTECHVNVYGVANEVNPYRWPQQAPAVRVEGICYDQNYAIVDSAATIGCMAHELGHFFGLRDIDNETNLMHRNGGRTDFKLSHTQQETVRRTAEEWLRKVEAEETGSGKSEEDAIGDVGAGYVDLNFDRVWAEPFRLHLSLTVVSFSTTDCELGFLLETDNSMRTGMPPEGIDYYVAFNPASSDIIFKRYDLDWISLNPTGISFRVLYMFRSTEDPTFDGPFEIPIGVSFDLPISRLFQRRDGNEVSFRAVGQSDLYVDTSPDVGLKSIYIPPIVGGISVPIDKLGLLAPYIALAVAVVAVTVGAAYSRKRWFAPKL